MHAMEAGFLTHGSFYWPTPSQRLARQWLILLAFVPVHSGASVRELHPLPASFTSIARTALVSNRIPSWHRKCQARFCLIVMRVAAAVPGEEGPRSASHEPHGFPPACRLIGGDVGSRPHIYRDGGLTIDVFSEPMAYGLQAMRHCSRSRASAGIASSRVHQPRSRRLPYFSRLG